MSIQIINMGGNEKTSIRRYEIRINGTIITYFTHDRREGLASCLKKAARAVWMQDVMDRK